MNPNMARLTYTGVVEVCLRTNSLGSISEPGSKTVIRGVALLTTVPPNIVEIGTDESCSSLERVRSYISTSKSIPCSNPTDTVLCPPPLWATGFNRSDALAPEAVKKKAPTRHQWNLWVLETTMLPFRGSVYVVGFTLVSVTCPMGPYSREYVNGTLLPGYWSTKGGGIPASSRALFSSSRRNLVALTRRSASLVIRPMGP